MISLQEHENRRRIIAFKDNRERKTKNMTHETQYAEKFKSRYADQVKREHEDGLKFFQVTSTVFKISLLFLTQCTSLKGF